VHFATYYDKCICLLNKIILMIMYSYADVSSRPAKYYDIGAFYVTVFTCAR